MVTRRSFLQAAIIGCSCCKPTAVLSSGIPEGGCLLNPSQSARVSKQDDLFEASLSAFATGDTKVDGMLGQALVRATQFFGIRPAFGFYNEMNAQASPAVATKFKGTWGTVLFGKPLFEDEFRRRDKTGMTVLAIIAHEFGHIIQFRRGLSDRLIANQPTVKRLELHADILAGFYIGSLKRTTPNLPVYSAGEVFHRIGDSNFNDRNHHGTPAERKQASQFGFDHGKSGNMTLEQIIAAGVEYVSRM